MRDLKDEFVIYEIALALKELGFDERCIGWYDKSKAFLLPANNTLHTRNSRMGNPLIDCAAPMWQQAIDWLREKHNIDVEIHASFGNGGWWWANLCYNPTRTEVLSIAKFENYYEAREKAVLKAIELINENLVK